MSNTQVVSLVFFGILLLAFIGLAIASSWKLFEKAGKPGWAALIPIYNQMVKLQMVSRPSWWIFLFFLPMVNFIAYFIVSIDLAKRFGKGPLYGIAMVPFGIVLIPILAFGSSVYTQMPNPD